uniref:Uncharacterized protein n=1 Tax=viral metagenome TaxID=1070528 RepID=A0A6M3KK61_9ZZZZ
MPRKASASPFYEVDLGESADVAQPAPLEEEDKLEEIREEITLIPRFWTPTMVEVIDEKIVLCSGAYDAEDVVSESTSVGKPWLFKNMAKVNGGGGYITGASITAETTAIASWFSLFLFTVMPHCALNDDVANTAPLLIDRMFYVPRLDFNSCSDLGSGMSEASLSSGNGGLPRAFVCHPESRDLHGVLVIRNAVDLADSTKLTIKLIVEQI